MCPSIQNFNSPSLEEDEGTVHVCVCLSVICARARLALIRGPLEVESWKFICGVDLTMLIKECFFVYVTYGVAKLQPFINISVLIFPL